MILYDFDASLNGTHRCLPPNRGKQHHRAFWLEKQILEEKEG